MYFAQLLTCAALLERALAVPVAQGDASATFICGLDQHDPASWGPSGAGDYMQNWFDTSGSGTTNWLNAMDARTTEWDGFDSVLDCKPLGGNTCPAPVVPCKDFTPPALRLIRIAATNAHDFFSHAYEELQSTAIDSALEINQVIADFAPDVEQDFNWLAAIAAAFFLVSPLATLRGAVAGATAATTAAAGKQGTVLSLIGQCGAPFEVVHTI